jgi:hypothetical protein
VPVLVVALWSGDGLNSTVRGSTTVCADSTATEATTTQAISA